jgi:hypothetical protein
MSDLQKTPSVEIIPVRDRGLILHSQNLVSRGLKELIRIGELDTSLANVGSGDIFEAVKAEDAEKVRAILRIDPTQANATWVGKEQLYTPLFFACGYNERTEVANLLISAGAEVNARVNPEREAVDIGYHANWTPLHMAAHRGNAAMADLLLSHGAHIEARDGLDMTPLHEAVLCQQEAQRIVVGLIERSEAGHSIKGIRPTARHQRLSYRNRCRVRHNTTHQSERMRLYGRTFQCFAGAGIPLIR